MKVCIIGSMNIDHVIGVTNFAEPGETVRGNEYKQYYGGKGGNQAIACSKLNLETTLVACVGSDSIGQEYLKHLKNHRVETKWIKVCDEHTGTAFIEVNHEGENKIVTIGGANYHLSDSWIHEILEHILDHDIFMFCLEIPKETTLLLLKLLNQNKKIVVLDPAPFSNFDPEMLKYIDYITPNETEYAQFENISLDYEHLNVVLKQGKKGASLLNKNTHHFSEGFSVDTIDTVGAGDTFNSALAYGILKGFKAEALLTFANAAGALATEKKGAQEGMPTLEEIKTLIKKR